MKKEDFKKFKNILNNFCQNLAEHTFFTFLILSLIVLMCSGLLFYKYSILAQKTEPEIIQEPIQFKERLYQKILAEWQIREARFIEADSQQYLNPFQPGEREEIAGEKKLSEERTQELLSNPLIQELLKTSNLYEFYTTKEDELLTIEERAQIWQELELGDKEDYQGTYNQNIKFLSELKKELTE